MRDQVRFSSGYNRGMDERVICEMCGRVIPPHGHYVVKIEIFADPSMPELDSGELEEKDFDQELRKLINEMKALSEEDLLEQVHRSFEFKVCRLCQIRLLANPLGKPREFKTGKN